MGLEHHIDSFLWKTKQLLKWETVVETKTVRTMKCTSGLPVEEEGCGGARTEEPRPQALF